MAKKNYGKVNKIIEPKLVKFPECVGMYPDEGCKESTAEKPGRDCIKENGLKCIHYIKSQPKKLYKRQTAKKKAPKLTKDQYEQLLQEVGLQ